MESIYYSPRGYWRGKTAIIKLAEAAKVSRDVAENWLERQAIWQNYLPPPKKSNMHILMSVFLTKFIKQLFCFYHTILLKHVDESHARTNTH